MTRLKLSLSGLGPVLRFSLAQLLKAKANIVTLALLMLLALVSVPAMSLVSSARTAAEAPEYDCAEPEYAQDAQSLSVSYSIVSRSEHIAVGDAGGAGYFVQLVYSVLVMMVSVTSVSYITGAVAQEKTSRLVELLMVSVKPLALIAGKILSVMLYMLMSFALVGLCFALSCALSSAFLDVSVSFLTGPGGESLLSGMSAGTAAAALVSLLLGYLTFATAAGVCGARCSGPEDIQGAAGGCMALIMLAYLASVVAGAIGGTVSTVCSLMPVLGVFCAPAQYALSGLSLPLLCLSWLVQAACAAGMALLCARVYAALLIYRGSRVGMSQILRMAHSTRRGARKFHTP